MAGRWQRRGRGHRPSARDRERALEGGVGTWERSLVAANGEPVQGVPPDLRLDPLFAQTGECLVAPVELDDVRLPRSLAHLDESMLHFDA
jgi:hypothetical protein